MANHGHSWVIGSAPGVGATVKAPGTHNMLPSPAPAHSARCKAIPIVRGSKCFNKPQACNALTFAMYERLAEICDAANEDRSLKVLILTGQGDKAFAAGTDINQFRAFKAP